MELIVAKIILQQLGGSKFIAMTGAKHFSGTERSLTGSLGKNPKSVHTFKVTLDPDDTYFVTFYRLRAGKCTRVSEVYGVDGDQLVETFERETGLRLSL
jgi:hypothetical protein